MSVNSPASMISINEKISSALRPLSTRQKMGIRDSIIANRKLLSPLFYAHLEGGECTLIDGHHRLGIHDELIEEDLAVELGIQDPEYIEIEELRGKAVEDAIEWVKKHQANRRNDESLEAIYAVGKEFRQGEVTSSQLASELDMSPSQVRHAGKIADKIDAAEELAPGVFKEILDSKEENAITPTFIRDSEPEDIVNRVRQGAGIPKEPGNGPLAKFKKLNSTFAKFEASIKALARAVNDTENETTPCDWSEKLKQICREASGVADDAQEAIKNWQFLNY